MIMTSAKLEHTLFVEKYRPKSLDTYLGNDTIKKTFSNYIKENDIPHLLLHGDAGSGKTTLAKIIANTLAPDNYIYINASDENSVDTVRDKIKQFAGSVGFGGTKIIILDECLHGDTLITVQRDGVEIQISIRDVIEETDLIKSWNIQDAIIEYRPFYFWNIGESDDLYEIELENDEIFKCTGTHKWYVQDDNENILVVPTTELNKYNHILSPQ